VSITNYLFPIESIESLVTNLINSFNASFIQVLKFEEIIINYPSDIESQLDNSSLSLGFLLLILTKNNNINKISNYLSKLYLNLNINIKYYLNIYNILSYIKKFNELIFKLVLLLQLTSMSLCVTPLIITNFDHELTNISYAGLYSKNFIDTYPTEYNNKIEIFKILINNLDEITNKIYNKPYFQDNKFKIYISLLENKKLLIEYIPKIQTPLVYKEEIIKTLILKNNFLTKEFLNAYLFNNLDSPQRNIVQEDYLFKLNDHVERRYY
jgi:hypothetical protein